MSEGGSEHHDKHNDKQVKLEEAPTAFPRIAGTLSVQWFFALFLFVIVAVPLALAGYIAVKRGSDTAFSEVQRGNQRAAKAIARSLSEYVEGERKLLQAIGEASVQMRGPDAHKAVLDSFLVRIAHHSRGGL